MLTTECQLDELMSSVSDCRALLQSAVGQRLASAGPIESIGWPTQPRSALAKARMVATVTNLQLAALSAIEDFCRLCGERRLRPGVATVSNASNSGVGTLRFPQHRGTSSNRNSSQQPVLASRAATEDSTMEDVCSVFETYKRQRSSRAGGHLGVYRSAVIRQLWEIHRLLRALVSESSEEPPPDHTSSSVTSASNAHEIILEVKGFEELQETPTRPQLRTHLTPAGHQTAATDQSVSEWSFACAHSVERQLCFASTLCVDSMSAQADWARSFSDDSPHSLRAAFEEESEAENSEGITLLSRVYRVGRAEPTCGEGSELTTVSTDGSIEGPKSSDVIVFQRVLRPTPAPKKMVRERQLATALARLKCRIDAIKLNLAEAEPAKPKPPPSSSSPRRRRRRIAPPNRSSLGAAAAEHSRRAS